jgi:peptide/nickel transport system ATP-binding protein
MEAENGCWKVALILRPKLVVCDESVSALDSSLQAQILNLLVDLKKDFGLAYLFISHDLSVVRYFADRVLGMYLSRIVESADHATLWRNPRHPYTRALLASIPSAKLHNRPAAVLTGEAFPSADAGSGCVIRWRSSSVKPMIRPCGSSPMATRWPAILYNLPTPRHMKRERHETIS